MRLQEATSSRLSHAELLELMLHDELAVRHDRWIGRRMRAAAFRDQKQLEDFDWDFNFSIIRQQIYRLPLASSSANAATHAAYTSRSVERSSRCRARSSTGASTAPK